jgi:regulator of nonsense transcripts 3
VISVSGNESQAVVEFAPFQKIPSEKRKPDARNATIDKGTVVSGSEISLR